jgi:Na+-translocating ferredoxin:NAD+ oxidoreductase subunit B
MDNINNTPNPYKLLAESLDSLPNGFPPTKEGAELRLLARLFSPEEAALAGRLTADFENPDQLARRIGGDPAALRIQLKAMAKRGLITAGQGQGGLAFKLMPFVVGVYEMQGPVIDADLAQLFEDYYQLAFGEMLSAQPPIQRVIPVYESVRQGLEVRPFDSAAGIIASARSWGVTNCICRKQMQLIGKGCNHPLEMCLTMSAAPGVFDQSAYVKALTQEEAMATLHRAAEAGLVHSVSNHQEGIWYICNCCTCSCGLLRGMAELGVASVVAHSGFVNRVDADKCVLCGECVHHCPFGALSLESTLLIDELRCAGCGVCTLACVEGALSLELRPEAELASPPQTEAGWKAERAQNYLRTRGR